MNKEARVLSILIDPETGHTPDHVQFVNPDNQRIETTMCVGNSYRIIHEEVPMNASYLRRDVLIHEVKGKFTVEPLNSNQHRNPRFSCVLKDATVIFSYADKPEERFTVRTPTYYFHLTTSSRVEAMLPSQE
ncbi:MAG: hypothetical protein N3A54_05485 [Patescibacteria group bacterium]|nr:hypothetical protein [Patescibacteria group bacterium]